jgi:alpha-beta hydrolase superfamily lysophospholipase
VKREEGALEGAGATRIWWQAWLPDADPRAVDVIAHGAGEHSGRYEHVGARLSAAGFAAYALDHRGHGRSEGTRALIDRLDRAVADLRSFIALARSRHEGLRCFLLGHSMGGCISLQYTLAHQEEIDGLVLSGPMAALAAASPATLLGARVLSTIAPTLGVYDVEIEAVSRDPAVVEAYASDPLVHHGKIPARTVAELSAAIGRFPDRVATLTLPMLVMHGTADRILPLEGARMVATGASSDDVTLTLYEGLYHEILNEPEQGEVLDEIVAWLEERA